MTQGPGGAHLLNPSHRSAPERPTMYNHKKSICIQIILLQDEWMPIYSENWYAFWVLHSKIMSKQQLT